MTGEDGGYYGLKGYSFQYINSLIKLLGFSDENDFVELERIEDISTQKELIQVKYKETKAYQPSAIREPVMNLMDAMEVDDRKLTLYCYFDDIKSSKKINGEPVSLDEETKISLEYLDVILRTQKENYSKKTKQEFISKFSIVFTKNYDDMFSLLINRIKESYSCNEESALIHYSCFMTYVTNKVITNNFESENKRIVKKKEINELVHKSVSTIVTAHLEHIIGKQKYYTIIRKQLFFHKKPDNIEKIFIIEVDQDFEMSTMITVTKEIIKKFLIIKTHRGRKSVDSPAPYIYFRNLNHESLCELKNNLFESDISLLDGTPFLGSIFYINDLAKKTKPNSDFKVKIINDEICLEKVLEFFTDKNLYIYDFYQKKKCELISRDLFMNYDVKITDINDINEFLIN